MGFNMRLKKSDSTKEIDQWIEENKSNISGPLDVMASKRKLPGNLDWDKQARIMINKYRIHGKNLKVQVINKESEQPEDKRLNGLKVKREYLDALLKDTQITDILILFAVRLKDIYKKDDDDQYFTTIITGIKDEEIQTTEVYDFCDPCPDKCAVNIDLALKDPKP